MATISDVIAGRQRWAVVASDAIDFMKSLPDDSVDLLLTSPPYEDARTYGLETARRGQAWVDWIHALVRESHHKVKGLIAIVCEGRTKNFKYSATPMLLGADLHRAGYNLRKPIAFHRKGIFGGGGPDWLRNDWENIICVTRAGKLPWSDNTACGHEPIYPPGGPPSHRTAGTRGSKNGDTRVQRKYKPPKLANPGNVIKCVVGGGHMGHPLASENEAPFPLKLAEFFVKSFCRTDGVVCDPFAGSSTTAHASVIHGRRFIGCDLRECQVELSKQRMASIEPQGA